MRIAYLVLMHKNSAQVVRLVDRLYTADDTFIIHVDRKTPEQEYEGIREGLAGRRNVLFTEKRHAVYYGDVSMVGATMECLGTLKKWGGGYDYAIVISGQHYPLVPPLRLKAHLAACEESLFFCYFSLPFCGWALERGGFDRYERWHFVSKGKECQFPNVGRDRKLGEALRSAVQRVFPAGFCSRLFSSGGKAQEDSFWTYPLLTFFGRRFPKGYCPYGGLHWFSIPQDAVDFLVHVHRTNTRLVRFFRYVKCPNEMFFQTVFLNSSFNQRVINDDLVFQKWTGGRHPEVLGVKNYGEMVSSGKMFARKFDTATDSVILDMIDKNLLSRSTVDPLGYP